MLIVILNLVKNSLGIILSMNPLKIVNDSDFTVSKKQLLTFTPFSGMIRSNNKNSPIAQLVEQMTVNHRVAGSSPAWGAKPL